MPGAQHHRRRDYMKRSLAWCFLLAVAMAYPLPSVGIGPSRLLPVSIANRPPAESSRTTFEGTTLHVSIAGSGHVDLRDPPLSFDFLADIDFGPTRPASG